MSAALETARRAFREGRHAAAADILRRALATDAADAALWALLAWCLDATGDADASRDALEQALARDPTERVALALGVSQSERAARYDQALSYAERLAQASPRDAAGQFNLGTAHSRLPGHRARAESAWRAALALEPLFWPALVALGRSAFERAAYIEAAHDFQAAAALAPAACEPWMWLGLAELRRMHGADALAAFEHARSLAPGDPDVWRGLAEAAELAGKPGEALAARREELRIRPQSVEAHCEAAGAFSRFGLDGEARAALARAERLAPERLLPRWLAMQLLPRLYRDEDERRSWRQHWLERLGAFEQLDLDRVDVRGELPECLSAATNFSLHYLGGTLREEQARYGAVLTRWTRACDPQAVAVQPPRPEGRLRVGFASAHLRPHTISKLFRAWLTGLDRARFEVVAIDLGPVGEGNVRAAELGGDAVLGPYDRVDRWREALHAAELDALVWLDIGMDGTTQALAPTRYAPVQCVAWGHPVTTGLDSIDWFLSSEAMEGEGADAGYTERLVRLPGLGICYPFPERARDAARLARDRHRAPVLLCAQSVYKLTPAHYGLFARLARALPEAHFEFCPHPSPQLDVRAAVADAFRPAFESAGQDFAARATIHPFLDQESFFALLARADVLLDTLDWSGGNTTLEALATGLPVVTLPGDTMRSRHTHGMLRLMGLDTELSARNEAHYLDIATRIARDPVYRASLVARIESERSRLFDDPSSIRALEDFLLRACGRR